MTEKKPAIPTDETPGIIRLKMNEVLERKGKPRIHVWMDTIDILDIDTSQLTPSSARELEHILVRAQNELARVVGIS